MSRQFPHVTDAELEVLKLLWESEPLSAREISESLYGSAETSDIGCVQKFLQRLEAKRLIHRDRSRHTHRFSPAVEKAEFAGRELEEMAAKLTDGSISPMITHLMQAKRLSKKDLDDLRKLLDDHDR